MPKIIDLSKDLASCYTEKAERQVDIERFERELYKREMSLTPAEGWPGKNAEQRELEKAKTLAADEIWNNLELGRQAQKIELTLLEGTIVGLEAERRGFEWEIRANLVSMLAANAVNRSNGGPVEESAFDDVSQQVVDDEIFYQVISQEAHQALSETFPAPDPVLEDHSIEDELPF